MFALHKIKRHPFPVGAHFEHSLVLTYALPAEVLRPLLPPGLELDCYNEFGFVAIALVKTRELRPSFLPRFCGQDFFLSGYRIFSKFTTRQGRHLRGLRILRSDTDKKLMAVAGNLLTHYNYCLAKVDFHAGASTLNVEVITPNAEADLVVRADLSMLDTGPARLPDGSPFPDMETARRFAGPLPFTFDYEKPTHSIVVIKGVRKKWNPQPVRVEIEKCTFFAHKEFEGCTPILANAFYISDIPYRWEVGRVEPLGKP
jgi:hypothetical protein